jgi:hypothetical protein
VESDLECSHKLLLCKTGFSFAISIVYPYGGGLNFGVCLAPLGRFWAKLDKRQNNIE